MSGRLLRDAIRSAGRVPCCPESGTHARWQRCALVARIGAELLMPASGELLLCLDYNPFRPGKRQLWKLEASAF